MASETEQKESKVTVTYWAGNGRAEQVRLLLAAAGVKFENRFLTKPEELAELRKAGYVSSVSYPICPCMRLSGTLCI